MTTRTNIILLKYSYWASSCSVGVRVPKCTYILRVYLYKYAIVIHPETKASLTSPANSSPSRVCSEPRLSSAPQCIWIWSSVHCLTGRPTKYIVTGIENDRCTAHGMRAETSFNSKTWPQIGNYCMGRYCSQPASGSNSVTSVLVLNID